MIEKHPFGQFIPPGAKYLILGSFPSNFKSPVNDWFYGSPRNQFWPIMEKVYQVKLPNKEAKAKLMTKLKMALTDVIFSCERKLGNNADTNLTKITYNTKRVEEILKNNRIEVIYLTSRFVEKLFRKHFQFLIAQYPVKLMTLPSPSPRYAALNQSQKADRYRQLLPKT